MKRRVATILLCLCGALALGWMLSGGSGSRSESPGPADRILIEKGARRLTLFQEAAVLRTFRVALGAHPEGRKQRQGDERTPEGIYAVSRIVSPRFGNALHVSYPNAEDVARADSSGDLPGGAILIHAPAGRYRWLGRLHRLADWTDGCIAVTSGEMEEILGMVPDGTRFEIVP